MNLAERVRSLREARGWTQQQLADMIQTEQPRISELERGLYPSPRISTLRKLAEVFGVSIDDLLSVL